MVAAVASHHIVTHISARISKQLPLLHTFKPERAAACATGDFVQIPTRHHDHHLNTTHSPLVSSLFGNQTQNTIGSRIKSRAVPGHSRKTIANLNGARMVGKREKWSPLSLPSPPPPTNSCSVCQREIGWKNDGGGIGDCREV